MKSLWLNKSVTRIVARENESNIFAPDVAWRRLPVVRATTSGEGCFRIPMIKSLLDFKPFSEIKKRHALFKDLTGQTFGRLIVIKPIGQKRYNYVWECECNCGKTVHVLGARLCSGKTSSCGCLKQELFLRRSTTHGKSRSRTYHIWIGMKNRCFNKKVIAFPRYGGRGITVCDHWMKYEHFVEDMGEAPDGMAIDRINNDGNYEPGNCRWTTMLVQARNSSKNTLITAFGETHCASEWAEKFGLNGSTILHRIRRLNWSPEKAMSKVKTPKMLTFGDQTLTVSDWSLKTGICKNTILKRIFLGWSDKDAVTIPPKIMSRLL